MKNTNKAHKTRREMLRDNILERYDNIEYWDNNILKNYDEDGNHL